MTMLVKYLLLLFGTIAFWGIFTSETDERRWKFAAYTAICLVVALCTWPFLQ